MDGEGWYPRSTADGINILMIFKIGLSHKPPQEEQIRPFWYMIPRRSQFKRAWRRTWLNTITNREQKEATERMRLYPLVLTGDDKPAESLAYSFPVELRKARWATFSLEKMWPCVCLGVTFHPYWNWSINIKNAKGKAIKSAFGIIHF